MPIEIRELVVKMSINDSEKQSESKTNKVSGPDKESILNECMEQVSDYFKSKKER